MKLWIVGERLKDRGNGWQIRAVCFTRRSALKSIKSAQHFLFPILSSDYIAQNNIDCEWPYGREPKA